MGQNGPMVINSLFSRAVTFDLREAYKFFQNIPNSH